MKLLDTSLVSVLNENERSELYGFLPPFRAEFSSSERAVLFVAVTHSSCFGSASFAELSLGFASFFPDCVVIEGLVNDADQSLPRSNLHDGSNQKEALENSWDVGECEYARKLADISGASIIGGDLHERDLFECLRQDGFSLRDVIFVSLFGPLCQDLEAGCFTSPENDTFRESFQYWAADTAKYGGGMNAPTLSEFCLWYHERFGMDLCNDKDWYLRANPNQENLAGEIRRRMNYHRDKNLLGTLNLCLESHRRVLICFGASHLANLWASFEQALGQPTVKKLLPRLKNVESNSQ